MKIITLLLFINLGFGFVARSYQVDLKSDKYLLAIFTERELAEMSKIIKYVDELVLCESSNKDIDSAYHRYLDKMNRFIQDSSRIFVPFKEEEKYQFLESLDSTLFNEFWSLNCRVKTIHYKDSTYRNVRNYRNLKLRPVGKYFDYILKLGVKDDFCKTLSENMEAAGDMAPGVLVTFPMKHQEFDFTIPKNRLWAAVYLLRIEENSDKKMERYLKGKK